MARTTTSSEADLTLLLIRRDQAMQVITGVSDEIRMGDVQAFQRFLDVILRLVDDLLHNMGLSDCAMKY